MQMKNIAPAWVAAGMLGTALMGCGGGDRGASTREAAAVVEAAASVAVTTRVVDGPLRNALVCLDANGNGNCEAAEAQGRTDATGTVTLQVPGESAGKYPLLAIAGTDAVDRDHGAVSTRFVLKAPADRAGLITPLTTLVQAYVELTGTGSTTAANAIKTLAGLGISPLQDFSAAPDAASVRAATLARLLVLTQQQQTLAIRAGVVGKRDLSGATATPANLDRAIRNALLGTLPALAAAAADPAVTSAANKEPLLLAAARDAVARDLRLDAAKALAVIGMAKLPVSSSDPRQASATLRGFIFADANNWFYRAMQATVADNTPDVNGLLHYYSVYARNSAGTLSTWGFSNDPARSKDAHWNGTAWVDCPLGFRSSHTRQINGRWAYNYCDGFELGSTTRSAVDISGQTLASVVTRMRSFPGGADGVGYAQWGPPDLTLLGTAQFPPGSRLFYYTVFSTGSAPTYDVQPSAVVASYVAPVAAGGDARNSGTPPCHAVTPDNAASYRIQPATLGEFVGLNRGTPCIFGPSTINGSTSLARNEWWSNSTASLGSMAGAMTQPAGTGNYYTTTALLRVAFGSNNSTTYYKCLERSFDGSTRNCTVVGRGKYSITALGDARVMRFTGLPLLAQRQGWSRVFVQRGGQIHFGYQNLVASLSSQARLNLPAANALLTQLGISPIVPK